jgi:hypothetical protein
MQTGIAPMTEESEEGRGLIDYTLPATAMEYLDKMRMLCEEKGAELILIKAPTNSWGYWWYDEWDTQIAEYAEKNSLAYYNFIPLCDEIGIDWSTDTYDEGVHLNVYGAEKLTEYFGRILSEKHGIDDRRDDSALSKAWEQSVTEYNKMKKDKENSK